MQDKIKNLEKRPKISVIILTYNRAKLLPGAIKSVLNQTFSDFELIIINNASTDNTEEVIKSFNDPRIIYKENTENNVLRARNIGFDLASGKYVVPLDDDDEFLPDALETISNKFAELSPKGVKILFFDSIDVESGEYSGYGIREEGYVSYKDYLCDKIKGDYVLAICRDTIGNNRFNPDSWGAMQDTLFMKLYRNNKIFYTPKIVRKMYREHGSRISHPEVSLLNNIKPIVISLKDFLEEHGEELKIFCPKCYGQRLAFLGSYQILNGDKQEGRNNVLKSFKFHFSFAHCSMLFLSFILNKNQTKFFYLLFLKVKKSILRFIKLISSKDNYVRA